MNFKYVHDQEILAQLSQLVKNERELLTQILHHLREVEKRKLFSDLGYQSLFEYAVKELKYSEGQAGRRIQAMRLLKELPQIEEKIQDGSLSLTHISQAQSYFREKSKANEVLSKMDKAEVLQKIQNTSSRESEKIILALSPSLPLPKESERLVSQNHTEVRFVMDEPLKNKLENVRSLLGAKALSMSFADLILEMAELSEQKLLEKSFGKKRVLQESSEFISETPGEEIKSTKADCGDSSQKRKRQHQHFTTPAPEWREVRTAQAISRAIKYDVWKRDHGCCVKCQSKSNLNIDHVFPRAQGGGNELENLRLLCFHCNQRESIKVFGLYPGQAIS